jgi:hypothetical protein
VFGILGLFQNRNSVFQYMLTRLLMPKNLFYRGDRDPGGAIRREMYMKALRINDYGAALHLDEVPVPTAGPGQVLVENHFTSMNGVDLDAVSASCARCFRCSFHGRRVAM